MILPIYALMATSLIAAMTFVSQPKEGEYPFGRFGLAGKGAVLMFGFVTFCLIDFILLAKGMVHFRQWLEDGDQSVGWFLSLLKNSSWALTLNVYACFAFIALLAWCVVVSRRQGKALSKPVDICDTLKP